MDPKQKKDQKHEEDPEDLENYEDQKENEDESDDEKPENLDDKEDKRKLIIILEKACLETGKINKKIELLNCDEHRKYINQRLKRDYSTYRPDITHQVKSFFLIFLFLLFFKSAC